MASNTPKPNGNIPVGNTQGVKFFNDHLFSQIRKKYNIPDDILRSDNFSFADISKGGGKGGDPMCRTKDKKYFIKEVGSGDHKSLLNIMDEYFEHIDSTDSLLARIVMHFTVPKAGNPKKLGKVYMVMNSWSPAVSTSDIAYLVDLKGCCDDKVMVKHGEKIHNVNKRFYKLHMFCGTCCWSRARRKYYEGKREALKFGFEVKLNPKQHELVLKQLELDVQALQKMGLMDYSFLVTILERPTNDFPNILPFAHNQPHVVKHGDGFRAYYLGIIDFLQDWTLGKKVAHCIKCTFAPKPISTIPPHAYGEQFLRHFRENITMGEHLELDPTPKHAQEIEEGSQGEKRHSTSFGMDDADYEDQTVPLQNQNVLDLVMIDEV